MRRNHDDMLPQLASHPKARGYCTLNRPNLKPTRMKLPKSSRNAMRELDRVVSKVIRTVESAQTVDKQTFERLLDGIILQIAKNRRLDINQVASATDQVVAEMPQEYDQLAEELKSWETLIAFLYLKYQKVLGVDTSMFER